MMEMEPAPQGTTKFADHLFKVGTLQDGAKALDRLLLSASHDLKGN